MKKNVVILLLVFNLLSACGVNDTTDPSKDKTLILAHRGFAGLWMQNSRNAVENTVKLFLGKNEKFHGIEIDIALTKDNVPVLAHEPWINRDLCARIDGKPLTQTLIKDLLWDELKNNYLCGGAKDPQFPNAEIKPESIMNFDEFLLVIKATPHMAVYLDIKLQEPLTPSAADFAKAVFQRWDRHYMTNPLYVEGPHPDAIEAYKRHAVHPITHVLSYPPFYVNENWYFKGAIVAINSFFNPLNALKKVEQANAQAIAIPLAIMNQSMQRALQNAGKIVIVFTPNSKQDIAKTCESGVNILITDYPDLGPCQESEI